MIMSQTYQEKSGPISDNRPKGSKVAARTRRRKISSPTIIKLKLISKKTILKK